MWRWQCAKTMLRVSQSIQYEEKNFELTFVLMGLVVSLEHETSSQGTSSPLPFRINRNRVDNPLICTGSNEKPSSARSEALKVLVIHEDARRLIASVLVL